MTNVRTTTYDWTRLSNIELLTAYTNQCATWRYPALRSECWEELLRRMGNGSA